MKEGLFVGRFQPFHLGHLAAIKYALDKVSMLYIAVGSAQKSHEKDNPFTAGERMKMIKAALEEEGVDNRRWLLIPVSDAQAHRTWISYIEMLVPSYEVVFSNDPLTIRLFREHGVKVKEVPLYKRRDFSATEVRRRMVEGEDWRSLVPKAVAKIINGMDGAGRLKALT